MSATAEMRARAVRDLLDPHEQQLLLRAEAGKSPAALATIYRQYEGENGVIEKLNELRMRVEDAARRYAGESGLDGLVRALGEDDDGDGGMPVKRVASLSAANGNVNGAGAAGKSSLTPPIRPAPAPSSAAQAQSGPASSGLDDPASSPSRRNGPGGGVRSEYAVDAVLAALREHGPLTSPEMVARGVAAKASVTRALRLLRASGRIVRDGGKVGPVGGRPSNVWRLSDEAPTVAPRIGAAEAPREGHAVAPTEPTLTCREALALVRAAREDCLRVFDRIERDLRALAGG